MKITTNTPVKKLAALIVAAAMMTGMCSVTAFADTSDSFDDKLLYDDFRRTVDRVSGDTILRVEIKAAESFCEEQVNDRYPQTVEESDYLNNEAITLFLSRLGIDESRVYRRCVGFVGAEVDLTKDELLALLPDPLVEYAYGYTMEQWEQIQEQIGPVVPYCQPTDPHEHLLNEISDFRNFTTTGYYDGNNFIIREDMDYVYYCLYCGEEMKREHSVETRCDASRDKIRVFGENSDLSDDDMQRMAVKLDYNLLTSMGLGAATADNSEMCYVNMYVPYYFAENLVKERMLERMGVFFGYDSPSIVFTPTQEELDEEEARSWSDEDEAKMHKALSPELFKKNTLSYRIEQRKTEQYLRELEEVKKEVGGIVFEKYLAHVGIAPEKVTSTYITPQATSYEELDSYYISANLTRGEIVELIKNDDVIHIWGETESQRVRSEEIERQSHEITYSENLDTDVDRIISEYGDGSEGASDDETFKGDIDGDGTITSGDALALLTKSAGSASLTASETARYDLDGDGEVTASDALIVLRRSVGYTD